MDHRQGVAPEHGERRFRQILGRHRWILALPVLTTDESGCPTRQYGGTPVSGIDRNSDPEERLFMRVMDVRGEAVRQGLAWPDDPSVTVNEVGEGEVSAAGRSEIDEAVVQADYSRPLQRHRHQEEEVLRAIREAGFDPARLPERKAGHRGVKALIRSKFTYSKSVFDKTWERLRAANEIAEEG